MSNRFKKGDIIVCPNPKCRDRIASLIIDPLPGSIIRSSQFEFFKGQEAVAHDKMVCKKCKTPYFNQHRFSFWLWERDGKSMNHADLFILESEIEKRNKTMIEEKKEHYLMQFFSFGHLPEHLQKVSEPFHSLALTIDDLAIPGNPEKTAALRKLLEAKDCAVRAVIFKG